MNKEDDEIKINYDSIFTDRTNNDENLVQSPSSNNQMSANAKKESAHSRKQSLLTSSSKKQFSIYKRNNLHLSDLVTASNHKPKN